MKTQPSKVRNKSNHLDNPALPMIYELEMKRAIELEAYKRAEVDGFRQSPMDYWLAAEEAVYRFF